MVRQDAVDVPGETGQTFKVLIYVAGVLKHTITGLTFTGTNGGPYTYTASTRGADDPDFTKLVTIKVFSSVGALDSMFCQSFSTVMTGGPGILPAGGRYEFGATVVGDLGI